MNSQRRLVVTVLVLAFVAGACSSSSGGGSAGGGGAIKEGGPPLRIGTSSGGRGRLPTWVVRMRRSLPIMGLSSPAAGVHRGGRHRLPPAMISRFPLARSEGSGSGLDF